MHEDPQPLHFGKPARHARWSGEGGTVAGKMMTANFARVFAAGARIWDAERDCTYTVAVMPAEALNLPSGVVVLVDPSRDVDDLRAPAVLAHNVPAGQWATELSLVSPLGGDGPRGRRRVIGARVRFVPEAAAVRWDLALADSRGAPILPYPKYESFRRGGFDVTGQDIVLLDEALWDDVGSAAISGGARGHVLVLQPNRDDLVFLWWGRDWGGNVVELAVELDRLLREAWDEVVIPADVLWAEGVVSSPELGAVGVVFDVLGPDDFPGLDDHSSGPTGVRPRRDTRGDPRTVFRVLAPVEGTRVRVEPQDAEGRRVALGGASTSRSGWGLEYWERGEAFSEVRTLRLRIPLTPAG